MNEDELKFKIATDFQSLVSDIAAAETLQSTDNPFSRVIFGTEFLKAQLNAPVLSDEDLKDIIVGIDDAIASNQSLKEVIGLVSAGLKLLAKYGIIL